MSAKPRLIFWPGQPDQEIFELEPRGATLGRGLDNDMVISDSSLSRRHAECQVTSEQVALI